MDVFFDIPSEPAIENPELSIFIIDEAPFLEVETEMPFSEMRMSTPLSSLGFPSGAIASGTGTDLGGGMEKKRKIDFTSEDVEGVNEFPLCPQATREWAKLNIPVDEHGEWKPLDNKLSEPSSNRLGLMLVEAIENANMKRIEMLLKHSVNLEIHKGDNGNNGLIASILLQNPELIMFFIEQGVSLNETNDQGYSALHYACMQNDPKLVQILLRESVNANAPVKATGDTPLHFAAMTGNITVAKLLLLKDVDVCAVNETGHTPQHYAANSKNQEMVELFEERERIQREEARRFYPVFRGQMSGNRFEGLNYFNDNAHPYSFGGDMDKDDEEDDGGMWWGGEDEEEEEEDGDWMWRSPPSPGFKSEWWEEDEEEDGENEMQFGEGWDEGWDEEWAK